MELIDKIRSKDARVSVLGLGYVGLPLVIEMAKAGFHVTGVDVNAERVAQLQDGTSYIQDVSSEELSRLVSEERFLPTTDFSVLAEVDTINICVPTPLRKTRDPDVSYIVDALEQISRHLHRQQLVILESTTYPGTTVELMLPKLEETGLEVGEDFFLAFSPERVDPGNPQFQTRNIPKVVGGVTSRCTETACALYESAIETVVPVGSSQVAEMVKLLENTFRSVNIGLVNELALLCRKMNINVWEVIDAAATKPFGFMPFYPGPGLGGHCIPVDPFYLSWKARAAGFEARFIELAGMINSSMPEHVATIVGEALNGISRPVRGSRILALGVAYKANINDVRESPALDVIQLLRSRGGDVVYHDPFVASVDLMGTSMRSQELNEDLLKGVHCAVVTTAHKGIDYAWVLDRVPCLVDSRNCLRNVDSPKLFRL